MATWKWDTSVMKYSVKCEHCAKSLRESSGAGIVEWADSKRYHVHCLLDKLAADYKPPVIDPAVYGFGFHP